MTKKAHKPSNKTEALLVDIARLSTADQRWIYDQLKKDFSSKELTVGCRARIIKGTDWYKTDGHNEVLLVERSGNEFSFLRLGKKTLKKKDPNTVIGGGAWIRSKDLEFIDADFDKNIKFIDWYETHEDDFCPDCGAWFPNRGDDDPTTGKDVLCPNKECPGRREAEGKCPGCGVDWVQDADGCEECGFLY